jgi:ApbE superfamily uncharacterized protein (UPF0280 family)
MPLTKIKKHIVIKESDVTIISEEERFINIGINTLIQERNQLENFIKFHPEFQTSFEPLYYEEAPPIVEKMIKAAELADVGPMAAIAGALADIMVDQMVKSKAKVSVVENGGEISIKSSDDIYIALYSLTTILKANIGFLFKGESRPLGVGTSSGTFGHAFSFGQADTVTIFADNAAVADAVATKICNNIRGNDIEGSIGKALEMVDSLEKVQGAFITRGKFVGKTGNIPEIVSIEGDAEKNYIKSKFEDVFGNFYKKF